MGWGGATRGLLMQHGERAERVPANPNSREAPRGCVAWAKGGDDEAKAPRLAPRGDLVRDPDGEDEGRKEG